MTGSRAAFSTEIGTPPDAPSDAFFIIGDCPLNVFVPVGSKAIFGGGLARETVEVTFPLSPLACLRLDRKRGPSRRRVGKAFVHDINRRTAFTAERFVISTHATRRVAEWVRTGAITVGRPKTDSNALSRTFRAKMAAARATAQAPRPQPDDPSVSRNPSSP